MIWYSNLLLCFLHHIIRSPDQVVLYAFVQLHKIRRKPSDAHDHISVFFRFSLRQPQYVGGYDIILNLHAALFKKCLDIMLDFLRTFLPLYADRVELDTKLYTVAIVPWAHSDNRRRYARRT